MKCLRLGAVIAGLLLGGCQAYISPHTTAIIKKISYFATHPVETTILQFMRRDISSSYPISFEDPVCPSELGDPGSVEVCHVKAAGKVMPVDVVWRQGSPRMFILLPWGVYDRVVFQEQVAAGILANTGVVTFPHCEGKRYDLLPRGTKIVCRVPTGRSNTTASMTVIFARRPGVYAQVEGQATNRAYDNNKNAIANQIRTRPDRVDGSLIAWNMQHTYVPLLQKAEPEAHFGKVSCPRYLDFFTAQYIGGVAGSCKLQVKRSYFQVNVIAIDFQTPAYQPSFAVINMSQVIAQGKRYKQALLDKTGSKTRVKIFCQDTGTIITEGLAYRGCTWQASNGQSGVFRVNVDVTSSPPYTFSFDNGKPIPVVSAQFKEI